MESGEAAGPIRAGWMAGSLYSRPELFVAAVYFLTGRIGLAVPFTSGNVSPIWPPAGVALAAFLLFGFRVWPAIAVGAFFVNLFTPIPPYAAAGIAVGNTAGPFVGAWLLRHTRGFDLRLGRLRDVFRLIVLAACVGPAVSATVGTMILSLSRVPAWSSAETAWYIWWLGDAMGVLIVAPLALAIPGSRAIATPRRLRELAALLAVTLGCSVAALHGHAGTGSDFGVLAFTFPFLVIWGATRFELLGGSLVTACIAAAAAWGAGYGLGPFAGATPLRAAALLQSFLTVLAVCGLAVAALTMERARLVAQQAAREAARLGEERLHEIAETANEGVWMLDSRLLTCFVNPRMAHMLGYGIDEMMGQPVVSFVFEEDRERTLAGLDRRQRGVSEQLESRYRRKDGSVLWARLSTTGSFDAAGRFTGVLAMVADISDDKRHEAERKAIRREILLLTRAVEQTADSVVVTDKRGVIEYVNPAFEVTTGYTRDEAIGRTPAILKSGHHDSEFYRNLWDVLLHGRTFRGTLLNRKKCGQVYWAEQTITPIKDEEDEITHFVSVLKDVTDLRREHEHEVQLRVAREVQQRFYQAPISLPGLDLAAASYPASETGGDYYDFIPGEGGAVYVAIGDASGHGLGASLVMALTRAYVRSFAALNLDVGEILTRVNRMLTCDLESNRFVTMLLLRIEAGSRTMQYSNAGHVSGFLLGADSDDGVRGTLASTGPPMGMFSDSVFTSREAALEARQLLLLVTDGVTESARADDEQFGSERLLAYVRTHSEGPARQLAEGVCEAARGFAAGEPQVDDVTTVVVKVAQSRSASAAVHDEEPDEPEEPATTELPRALALNANAPLLADPRQQEARARTL